MAFEAHKPVDSMGQRINKGDVVQVVGVPDLSGMTPECRAESEPVFAYLVGRFEEIVSFDEYGCAQLVFEISEGEHRGHHSVLIEPYLLRASSYGTDI